MTIDDALKIAGGCVASLFMAITTWLFTTTLKLKEDLAFLTGRVKSSEEKMTEFKAELVTRECVREEIEAALEKRDKREEQHRAELEKFMALQIREIVREEVVKGVRQVNDYTDKGVKP